MTKKENYEAKAEELIGPILSANSFTLYDIEYVKEAGSWYLRAYIDKPGGITIDDCELVSRSFGERLDEIDLIDEAYILEVSSPGLGRQLKKDRHFSNSIGEEVECKLFKVVDGEKEFTGILTGFDKDSVTLDIDGKKKCFLRNELAFIRLTIDF